MNTYRKGFIGAILDEYERALNDLLILLESISEDEYLRISDTETTDPDCRSVQTVISHVIRSGYGYPSYIRPFFSMEIFRPETEGIVKDDAIRYLKEMFEYNLATFEGKHEMTESEASAITFKTRWGADYDLEGIMEHAIVHILRHRRQIAKFMGR